MFLLSPLDQSERLSIQFPVFAHSAHPPIFRIHTTSRLFGETIRSECQRLEEEKRGNKDDFYPSLGRSKRINGLMKRAIGSENEEDQTLTDDPETAGGVAEHVADAMSAVCRNQSVSIRQITRGSKMVAAIGVFSVGCYVAKEGLKRILPFQG